MPEYTEDTPPADVVQPEREPITRADVQRYSDGFGFGRGRDVLRPGKPIENADGELVAMAENEHMPTLLAGMNITVADVRRLGYTAAELDALPGIYVVDGGVRFQPRPGTRWNLITRQIEEYAS